MGDPEYKAKQVGARYPEWKTVENAKYRQLKPSTEFSHHKEGCENCPTWAL